MVGCLKGFETFAVNGGESGVLKGSFWTARRQGPLIALTLSALSLAGCVTAGQPGGPRAGSADVLDQVREIDLSARFPQRVRTAEAASAQEGPQAQSYYGTGNPVAVGVQPSPPDDHDDGPLTTGAIPAKGERDAGNQGYELN